VEEYEIHELPVEADEERTQRPFGPDSKGNYAGAQPLACWEGYSLATLTAFLDNC
jgi:hypothetical protein